MLMYVSDFWRIRIDGSVRKVFNLNSWVRLPNSLLMRRLKDLADILHQEELANNLWCILDYIEAPLIAPDVTELVQVQPCQIMLL